MLAAACVIAIVIGDSVTAQNPPARGMRWSKAAPFPEPEEELYGTVVNGKFYVIGGFGFTPPGVPAAAAGREQRTLLQLPAGTRVRVRPGAGQVDEEEEHSGRPCTIRRRRPTTARSTSSAAARARSAARAARPTCGNTIRPLIRTGRWRRCR